MTTKKYYFQITVVVKGQFVMTTKKYYFQITVVVKGQLVSSAVVTCIY